MEFNGLSVIVVEDHDFQRRVALRLLKQVGVADLLEACNGREALNVLMARGEAVDVLVCDLDMPEMDGVEFISHVAVNKLARALVVVSGVEVSILHTVETMARAYGIQVLETIPKPLSLQQLSESLEGFQASEPVAAPVAAPDQATREELLRGIGKREFLTFFQPKIAMATGELTGVETLVRWYRPGLGVLTPKDFIHRLEEEGLMDELTELLMRQTCIYLRAWDDRGVSVNASVNISMSSLGDIQFADKLHAVAREEDCDPSRITLELTESDVMTKIANVLNVLARFRLKGFRLSIDDFGTGYSTLKQLNNMPFTELKIDQAFVQNAPGDPRSRAIVETSLQLARKLGLKSVAEGVETRAQWDLLRSLGSDEAQGYFISRPMPGHQLPDWKELWLAPEVPELQVLAGAGAGLRSSTLIALPECLTHR